jgi:hypothetical protein
MFHEFVVQGYTITAAILVVQYLFHKPYRESYVLLARMANRLIWFWCFFLIAFIFLGFVSASTLGISLFTNESIYAYELLKLLSLLLYPLGIILIGMLFRTIRNRPLIVMFCIAALLNLSRIKHGEYISWSSLIYGLLFWVMVVVVHAFGDWVMKGIRSKDNDTLPDRI